MQRTAGPGRLPGHGLLRAEPQRADRQGDRPGSAPSRAVPDRALPGAPRGRRAHLRPGRVDADDLRLGRASLHRRPRRAAGPAVGHRHHRHPLRHQVVQVRHHLDGCAGSGPVRAGRSGPVRHPRPRACASTATPPTCRWPTPRPTDSLVVYAYEGEDIEPVHGGPVRLFVPHLYFWKSSKWLRGLELLAGDTPGFWERNGYHNYGDPFRRATLLGRLSAAPSARLTPGVHPRFSRDPVADLGFSRPRERT